MNLDEVDFGSIGEGGMTVFCLCFQRYLDTRVRLKRPKSDCVKLIDRTEEMFFFLIEQGSSRGYNTDDILEIPNKTGLTYFLMAANKSHKITKYIKLSYKYISKPTTLHHYTNQLYGLDFQKKGQYMRFLRIKKKKCRDLN